MTSHPEEVAVQPVSSGKEFDVQIFPRQSGHTLQEMKDINVTTVIDKRATEA